MQITFLIAAILFFFSIGYGQGTARVLNETILRAAPSSKSKIVLIAKKGERLEVKPGIIKNGWQFVSTLNKESGWIESKNIDLESTDAEKDVFEQLAQNYELQKKWIRFFSTETTDYFFNKKKLSLKGQTVDFWIKLTAKNKKSYWQNYYELAEKEMPKNFNSEDFEFTLYQYIADCNARKTRLLRQIDYWKSRNSDDVDLSDEFRSIVPDTLGEEIYKQACSAIKP